MYILARVLKTQKSNISRLENVDSEVSPTLSTIERYARAAGYRLEINFLPETQTKRGAEAVVSKKAGQKVYEKVKNR